MNQRYTNVPTNLIDQTLPFASGGKGRLENNYSETYDNWKRNDNPETRGALLKSVKPVIDTAVHSYAGSHASPAIRSQAKLMALEAFKSYDPNKGNMKNHLLSNLQRLQRIAPQSSQVINIPERILLDRKHLQEVEEELRDEMGRDPSDMEIADKTGLSLKRISHIRKASSGINTGSIMDEQGQPYSPASMIPGATNIEDAWMDMVYYDLGDVDRAIMDYSFGLHNTPQLGNAEIAERLGLSPGAISQRKTKIQAMLDSRFEISPFE